MITGKLYNVLKFCALVLFPAVGTLYFALAGIWGLPAAEQVIGTIIAVDTFLGVILQISSNNYNSSTAVGTLNVIETDTKKKFDLAFEGDPEYELESADRVVFKVNRVETIDKTRENGVRAAKKKTSSRRKRSALP